uniref:Uncharacterized protein n=1 Tax=Nelumbo nucifera TaxID=4432 RepID=A0A822XLB9_NELNU|nr:TPA_asm: hypothetical protein HUJ06_021424 [Nelumbo nucifera]
MFLNKILNWSGTHLPKKKKKNWSGTQAPNFRVEA